MRSIPRSKATPADQLIRPAAVAGATVEIGQQTCFFGSCFLTCNGSFLPCATNSTDASGHYVLETGIASGSYNITASKGSSKAGLSSLLALTAGTSTVAPTLTLTLSAVVVTPAHITGVVKDSHENLLKDAYVNGEGISSHIGNDTETNAQGQFNLEIPLTLTDSVNITASDTGYTEAFHVVSNVAPGVTVSAGTLVLTTIQPGGVSGSIQGQIISSLIRPRGRRSGKRLEGRWW